MTAVAILGLATAAVSAVLTGVVRLYAIRRAVLDVPNERSSHVLPMPRGGGLAIVASVVGSLSLAYALGWTSRELFLAVTGGGVLIAAIGWMDDHRPTPAPLRLVVHFAAAAWAVYWLGGLSAVRVGTTVVGLGVMGSVLSAVGIVWLLNLYNFMDGIDGIAGVEALTVGVGAAILAGMAGAVQIAVVAALIAAACAGFLVWNWEPARIFMGDVGSGFLGYCLAVTALASELFDGPSLLIWGVLLGVFAFDATATLIRRAIRGERISVAHRSHAYQRAVQSGYSHAQVTGTVAVLDVVLFCLALIGHVQTGLIWLIPIAAGTLLTGIYLAVERRVPMFEYRAPSGASRREG